MTPAPTHDRPAWAEAFSAGPRRLAAGLALIAVAPVVVLVCAGYQLAAFDDETAYHELLWAIPLLTVAAVAGIVAVRLWSHPDEWLRRRAMVAVGVLAAVVVVWFVLLTTARLAPYWTTTLLCVPSTLFGLVLMRRAERNRRVSWLLLAAPFLWGACVATQSALATADLRNLVVTRLVTPGTAFMYVDNVVTAVNEEGLKALGVLAVLVVFGSRINGVLGGLVTGAVVGIGFQFTESVLYMAGGDSEEMLYQFWTRQYAGLFASHLVYTGIAGACLGLAFHYRGALARVLCAGAGFLAAVTAHAAWNVAVSVGLTWRPDSSALLIFVAQPVNAFVFHSPSIVLFCALVIGAQRYELRGLRRGLHTEASVGLGAIRPGEVPVLSSASARFRLRLRLLARRDLRRYRHVRALHEAQLELAYVHWHRAHTGGGDGAESRLRRRILRLRLLGLVATPAPAGTTVSRQAPLPPAVSRQESPA
ncbi:MAG: PrsW family intramembrane metalloprotease [Streptosporangiales bacterium]|nr:PrsW family intramembrane metalloprotease [Streptosporangiales bacterium]